ncbi:MAG: 7-cyano-7-deazaguanine synthase [Candidatus Thermoplasmatota archaeon]|nr:7-cyano-7-deazaguanine synthase [Candidatus Thermoplasmatota archaeon]
MDYKVVVLISGGIDSPVAAHLLAEKGAEVSLLSLDNRPFTDESTLNIVDQLVEKLKERHEDISYHRGTFGHVQKHIASECDEHMRCLLCRRMMYRAASTLAEKIGADAIGTGESLGQVASQTLSNLESIDKDFEITIHRPLIGMDKNEVIEIGKKIGTYEISIQPSICCMLTPEEPRIRSDDFEIRNEEKRLDISDLMDQIEFKKIEG